MLSGTVPLKLKISGDIVPSANIVIPADYRNEDLCVNNFEEGSLIIYLDVSHSAIRNVGYFLTVIDMLLSALLQRHSAPIKDSSNYVIVSMEFPSCKYRHKTKGLRKLRPTVCPNFISNFNKIMHIFTSRYTVIRKKSHLTKY